MNIYAIKGHKVVVTKETAQYGSDSDKLYIQKFCKIGRVYTVYYTEVHEWQSSVVLEETPRITFNTVNFEDVEPQSKEDDMKNPYWRMYHRYVREGERGNDRILLFV